MLKKSRFLKLSKIIWNHFRIISRGPVSTFMCLGMILQWFWNVFLSTSLLFVFSRHCWRCFLDTLFPRCQHFIHGYIDTHGAYTYDMHTHRISIYFWYMHMRTYTYDMHTHRISVYFWHMHMRVDCTRAILAQTARSTRHYYPQPLTTSFHHSSLPTITHHHLPPTNIIHRHPPPPSTIHRHAPPPAVGYNLRLWAMSLCPMAIADRRLVFFVLYIYIYM
jgi:hypothetical protein